MAPLLEEQGVVFLDTDTGLREHEELFREYFGSVIPPGDNKFSALNTAVWSGGSFIYVPKGVNVEIPLKAYFRINTENMGQFERTLIIVDEGAYVHYVEGCTAPIYSSDSLHSAVVEIIVKKGARCRYTTIQNWSNNVYNLVTKRAVAYKNATMEWVDGNLGSKLTMKYPSCYLIGEGAHGEILSIAYAGDGQHQDTGGKVVHAAPRTTSQIVSKSISKGTGRSSYRGLCKVYEGAVGAKSNVECDALLLDETSRTDTYPYIEIDENLSTIGHEASVSKVGEEQLFYLMSRGLSEEEAMTMADRIVVMHDGIVEQIGSPLELYDHPANKFVAGFMGTTNFIRGNVQNISDDYAAVATNSGLILHGRGLGLEKDQDVDVAVRPENVEFLRQSQTSTPHGDLNIFDARVDRATYVGELIDYQLTLGESIIRAKGDVRRKRAAGENVKIYIDPDQLPVLRE